MEKKFEVNDQVIHCREGLAVITGTTTMGDKEYFLAKLTCGSGETIYVPKDSAHNIIRPIMSVKEADAILLFMKSIPKDFNPNTKQRRDAYKRRLSSGDVKEIAYLSRQLYHYYVIGGVDNTEIKLGPVDMDMLTYADNMLMDEFAISYKKDRDKISDFINERIDKMK